MFPHIVIFRISLQKFLTLHVRSWILGPILQKWEMRQFVKQSNETSEQTFFRKNFITSTEICTFLFTYKCTKYLKCFLDMCCIRRRHRRQPVWMKPVCFVTRRQRSGQTRPFYRTVLKENSFWELITSFCCHSTTIYHSDYVMFCHSRGVGKWILT